MESNNLGLKTFSIGVDFFSDANVKKMIGTNGSQSVSVYLCILGEIYKNGYYLKWDDAVADKVAEMTCTSRDYVLDVLVSCFYADFFDAMMYLKRSVLTSEQIQENYTASVCGDARIKKYDLCHKEHVYTVVAV